MKASLALKARLQGWWQERAPQEQRLILIAAALIAVALLWSVAVAPAWRTLNSAPKEHARLDAQMQQMLTLQEQARSLKAQPRSDRQQSIRALESSVQSTLGAQAQTQRSAGDGITVSLRAVPAEQLATWLTQARVNARAVPRELRLTRNTTLAASNAAAPTAVGTDTRSALTSAPGLSNQRRRAPNSNANLPRTPEAEGAQPEVPEGAAATPSPTLARSAAPRPAPSGPPPVLWDGTVVLSLPNS